MEQFLEDLTERVWLEQGVTLGDRAQSADEQLEAMFQVRHGLRGPTTRTYHEPTIWSPLCLRFGAVLVSEMEASPGGVRVKGAGGNGGGVDDLGYPAVC
ncbi:MAG: hypothetical protein WCF04_01725 [Candidatus Nanopelagicales bacterium]